ncbi:MAG TPA: YbaB/EbfC family nucleoid-associated protein [Candidatus Brocadiia bacterium]|nr:YbaB/EbfC family nucleoid-associated protein [Candidatus Brocadiia bacterium]
MARGFGDMSGLLREAQKQAQSMQKSMAALEEDLKQRVVDGTAGGGVVKAFVNGQRELVGIKISPEVVDPKDVEMLEDMVTAAVSQALKKAAELHRTEMNKLTGGLSLPGLF